MASLEIAIPEGGEKEAWYTCVDPGRLPGSQSTLLHDLHDTPPVQISPIRAFPAGDLSQLTKPLRVSTAPLTFSTSSLLLPRILAALALLSSFRLCFPLSVLSMIAVSVLSFCPG